MHDEILPLLRDYFQCSYPNGAGATLRDLICLNNGWESDVYSFTADWAGHSEDLILRIYPGLDAYEKAGNEYRALIGLRQAGYPVPRVDLMEREHSPFGQPFMIMERIHGEAMWGPLFHHPDGAVRRRLLEQFCGLFTGLHALDWRGLVDDALGDPEEYTPAAMLAGQMTRFQGYMDALPVEGFRPAWEWVVEHSRQVQGGRVSFIHWDFHPNNILLRSEPGREGEAVVIDWTGLDLADPRMDLAWTLTLITSYEGAQWREPILREYERQSGAPVGDMTFFDAAACLRRMYSVIVSVLYGAEKLGMRPGAEAMMRQQAPALRQVYSLFRERTGVGVAEVEQFLAENGV